MKKRQKRKTNKKISQIKVRSKNQVRKNTCNRKKGKRKDIKHKISKKGNDPCDRGIIGISVSSFIQYSPSSRGGTNSSHDNINKQHQLDDMTRSNFHPRHKPAFPRQKAGLNTILYNYYKSS